MELHGVFIILFVMLLMDTVSLNDHNCKATYLKDVCRFGKTFDGMILCLNNETYIRIDYALGGLPNRTVVAQSRYAFYNYTCIPKHLRVYSPFPHWNQSTNLTTIMCDHNNREGFLCQRCKPNYGPSAYTSECHPCHHPLPLGIMLYLFTKLLPATVLYILTMTFRINIVNGPLLGYICFCQVYIIFSREIVTVYNTAFFQLGDSSLKKFLKLCHGLSAVWTLDFLEVTKLVRPFCLSSKLLDIDIMLLNFISVFYSVLLVVVSYILIELHARDYRVISYCWKPFHICLAKLRRNWSASDSIIHAFASLLLLSFTTMQYNAYSLLNSIEIYDLNTSAIVKSHVLFSLPSMHSYSIRRICCTVVVFVLLLVFGGLPSLLLLLHPFQVFRARLRSCCSERVMLRINIFVETFQGPFKDGCSGTRDFRVIPGIIACAILIMTLFSYIPHSSYFLNYTILVFAAMLTFLSVFFAYARPCKQSSANISLTFHTLILALLGAVALLWRQDLSMDTEVLVILFAIMAPLPHLVMFVWVCHNMNKRFQIHSRCLAWLRFLMGRRHMLHMVNMSLLPDRLIHSQEYEELS